LTPLFSGWTLPLSSPDCLAPGLSNLIADIVHARQRTGTFMKVTSDLEEEVGLERSHMTLVKVTFDASGSNVTLLKNQLVALMVGRETEFPLI
jgi:hypothetical protein